MRHKRKEISIRIHPSTSPMMISVSTANHHHHHRRALSRSPSPHQPPASNNRMHPGQSSPPSTSPPPPPPPPHAPMASATAETDQWSGSGANPFDAIERDVLRLLRSSSCSASVLVQDLHVLRLSYELMMREAAEVVDSGSSRFAVTTQRDVYYRLEKYFTSQTDSNRAIRRVSERLRIPRAFLGFCAGARGAIGGCVTIDGVDLTCGVGAQGLVVDDALVARLLQSPSARLNTTHARYLLLVEKDAIFYQLMARRVFDMIPVILLSGFGFPSGAVRNLAHLLYQWSRRDFGDDEVEDQSHRDAALRCFGLVDYNPAGVDILLQFAQPPQEESFLALQRADDDIDDPVPISVADGAKARRCAALSGYRHRGGAAEDRHDGLVLPLHWLGLRSSHLVTTRSESSIAPPTSYGTRMSDRDQARLRRLLSLPKKVSTPRDGMQRARRGCNYKYKKDDNSCSGEMPLSPPSCWVVELEEMLRRGAVADIESVVELHQHNEQYHEPRLNKNNDRDTQGGRHHATFCMARWVTSLILNRDALPFE